MGNNRTKAYKQAFFIGTITFFLAIIIAFTSDVFLKRSSSLIISFIFLLIIILTGIFFDMIGTAATAAYEEPFHAKAAKKIKGAKQAYRLIKNADKVASFSNDVIGDISGTVSGALGAAIVFQLITSSSLNEVVLSMFMTGFVAASTVGGKAFGKRMAIDKSDVIMYKVGYFLAVFEDFFGKDRNWKNKKNKKYKKKNKRNNKSDQSERKREKVGKS